jgi:cell division protein FtsI/penicillin-binding protein 2
MSVGSVITGQRRRIIWLAVVFAGVGLILLGRLVYWQLFPHAEIITYVGTEDEKTTEIPAVRGNILDANGQYLVASTVQYKVSVTPRLLSDPERETYIPQLSSILKVPEDRLEQALAQTDKEYVLLADEQSESVAEQIDALPSNAFSLEMTFRRVYPDDDLAASTLGFVDYKYRNQGQYGLEQYYEQELQGTRGEWRGISDSWGQPILVSLAGYAPAKDGADIVLTLDRNIQHAAERILSEGITKTKALAGNIVVLDPRTGAILALANYPSYRPSVYWDVNSNNRYINTAVSAIYEPGSVFKPLTLAAALEARAIRPTDTYDDRGEIIVGQQRIQNSDRKAHGRTSMTELLAYSLNVGAAHVATLVGPTRFYEVIRRFGFSEITGVDLAYEVPGVMRVPGEPLWHISDLGTNSFGQGISVTPLQMAAAYGALANNGVLMRPYLLSEMRQGGQTKVHEPFRVRSVVSAETARQTTELMVNALELGLKKATIPGYRMAGKSGTSGIPDQEGGYQGRDVIASFVGFGPVPNPRFVILVKYDKPQDGYWGGDVAAPEFREMAKFLLDYYGIAPTP